ncbi:MAG TPA: hypothetical protein VE650_00700 [Acetobacteraceae bacterium]|nr:hypothetical protein [Acetobacteraceae bacterium]
MQRQIEHSFSSSSTEHSFSSSSTEQPAPSRPRPTRAEQIALWIASGLVLAGFLLGVSKHGRPLVPRARELFIPAGLILLLLIAWWARRRRPDQTSMWLGLAALALIGVGAHEATDGPWTLLAVPGAVLATLFLLRTAIVGARGDFFQRMQRQRRADRPRSARMTRVWICFGAVLTATGAGLAVAAALPPGPSVDVDVSAVAYGGDESAGQAPTVFGVAVKNAHCSHGANAYTVAIGGRSYSERCSATAGGAVHTVTLGLRAGKSYALTITPVQTRSGRKPRRGSPQKHMFSIPSADSKVWRPIGGNS